MSINVEYGFTFDEFETSYEDTLEQKCFSLVNELSPDEAQLLRKISADFTIASASVPAESPTYTHLMQRAAMGFPFVDEATPLDSIARFRTATPEAVLMVNDVAVDTTMLENIWLYIDMPDEELPFSYDQHTGAMCDSEVYEIPVVKAPVVAEAARQSFVPVAETARGYEKDMAKVRRFVTRVGSIALRLPGVTKLAHEKTAS